MLTFEGKRVVITGAAGGVGRALVTLFSSLGASIVACDKDKDGLATLDVTERQAFDLADTTALNDAVAGMLACRTAPSVVISNAGWTRAETLADVDDTTVADEINGNLKGAMALTRALLPALRTHKTGAAIVFVSSVNAHMHFGNPVYAAAKAGLEAWMRALATEEGPYGVRANAVAPGSIRTPAWDHRLEADPALADRLQGLYPLGRFVTAEEVAQTVAFLASALASGITGVSVPVDAGLLAGNRPFLNALANLKRTTHG